MLLRGQRRVDGVGRPKFDSHIGDAWCGACAKCAFVYCALSAFRDDASRIFHGVDLYGEPDMIPFFDELVGSKRRWTAWERPRRRGSRWRWRGGGAKSSAWRWRHLLMGACPTPAAD